nr:MAG TPA: hypothetical protein [Caudoviricetes sp.]
MGCGYVGLIVSSWSTLTREGWASAAAAGGGPRAPRGGRWEARGRPNGVGCVPTWVGARKALRLA